MNYKILIYSIGEILFYFGLHYYFVGIFKKSFKSKFCILAYISGMTFGIVTYFNELPGLVNVLTGTVINISIAAFYERSIMKNFLYNLLFMVFESVAEILTAYAVLYISPFSTFDELFSNNLYYLIALYFDRFILFLACYIIYALRNRLSISKTTTHFWPIILVLSISSNYMLYFIYKLIFNGIEISYLNTCLYLGTIAFINISVYYLFERQCKDYEIRISNINLEKQIESQHIKELETDAYLNKIEKINHDRKNICIGLISLAKQKKYDELIDELNCEISEYNTNKKIIINTPDDVINTILTYKSAQAERFNIDIKKDITIADSTDLEYNDLSIIIGNLLDNSIEYLSTHTDVEPTIYVYISYDFGILKIQISNHVKEPIEIKNNFTIHSSKKDRGHGIGLSSVNATISKLNGIFELECKNNIFTATVTIMHST